MNFTMYSFHTVFHHVPDKINIMNIKQDNQSPSFIDFILYMLSMLTHQMAKSHFRLVSVSQGSRYFLRCVGRGKELGFVVL